MSKSRGIIPKIEPQNGKWICPDCQKPWDSPQAYSMHWYRTHGKAIIPKRQSRLHEAAAVVQQKKKSSYDPKKSAEYYQRKKAERALAKTHSARVHAHAPSGKLNVRAEATAMLLEECPVCHTPLKPIIEGIMKALEERMKRHGVQS